MYENQKQEKYMYENQNRAAIALGNMKNQGLAGTQKLQTVTDQLRDNRDTLHKLNARMEDLIVRTGVNAVNEIQRSAEEPPQSGDTRSVTHEINLLCERLHQKMDVLDNIA